MSGHEIGETAHRGYVDAGGQAAEWEQLTDDERAAWTAAAAAVIVEHVTG